MLFSILPLLLVPVLGITTSSADKALATSITEYFDSTGEYFRAFQLKEQVTYSKTDGLKLSLAKRLQNPSIVSTFYIFFGHVSATIKTAPGQGIVSTLYLQSDDLDEIDYEWLGGDDTQVQTNFFSKGDTSTYDRGAFHSVNQPADNFYKYEIDWTEERIQWIVNGNVVRTLQNTSASGYPQSPSKLYLGVWAGGDPSNEAGTIEWAGGQTDYSKGPFNLYCKEVTVSDYSTGKEYKYKDSTGSWTNIEAVDGTVLGNKNGDSGSGSSSSKTTSGPSSSSQATSSVKTTNLDDDSSTTTESSGSTSKTSDAGKSTESSSGHVTSSGGSSSTGSSASSASSGESSSETSSSATSSSPDTQSSSSSSSISSSVFALLTLFFGSISLL